MLRTAQNGDSECKICVYSHNHPQGLWITSTVYPRWVTRISGRLIGINAFVPDRGTLLCIVKRSDCMKVSPQFVGPIVMAFIMAMIMTGFVTWMNLGFNDAFFVNWGRAFVFAWPVASIAAFLALPIAPKITLRIVRLINGTPPHHDHS